MNRTLEAAIDELLVFGVDDFISTWTLAGVTADKLGAKGPAEIRSEALLLLRAALQAKLVEVGDVGKDGFHAWQLSASDAIDEVARKWPSGADDTPFIGTFWLRNTGNGMERGKAVLAREQRHVGASS
jgi:hypothetical protein